MAPPFEMNPLSENLTLDQMLVAQLRDNAELKRLAEEREYLERKLKLNAEAADFIGFVIARRDDRLAKARRVAHRSSPWTAGYYSHDAD